MSTLDDLDNPNYIKDSLEYFSNKKVRNPEEKKYKDARKARKQLTAVYGKKANTLRYPHTHHFSIVNGVPCFIQDGKPKYVRNTFRGKSVHYNGKKEAYMRGISQAKYDGKSSRRHMREKAQWWESAEKSLDIDN